MGKRVRKLTRRNKIMRKSLRRNSKISRKSIRRKSKISRRNKSIKKRRVNRKTLRRYKLRGGGNAAVAEATSAMAAKKKTLTPDNENHDEMYDLIFSLVTGKFTGLKPDGVARVANRFYKTYQTMLFICKELEEQDNFNVIVANIIVNNAGRSEAELINEIYTSFERPPTN
jgi:hypothetical protein